MSNRRGSEVTVMRRIVGLVFVVVVLLLTMVAGISTQDATPPSGSMKPPESFELAPASRYATTVRKPRSSPWRVFSHQEW
jgi:hypothetical protein